MKASVFPGSSGEPLFLNLILCKRRVKLSFPIMGSTGGHGVSAKRSVKKRSVRFPDTPLSVLRGDLALSDPVETAELLQVPGGADQHDLGESPGAEVPKARHLLTCADAGVDHGRLGLPVVGACLPLFPEKHPASLLKSAQRPPQETPRWRPPSGPAAPPRRSSRAGPPSGGRSCRTGRGCRPRSPRRSPYSQCGPPRSG